MALFNKRITSPKPTTGAPRNAALLVTIGTAVIGAVIIVYIVGVLSRQVTVVVPVSTIPRFSVIKPGDLETTQVHVTDLLPGAVTNPTALIDKVSAFDLAQGEQITANDVIPYDGHSSLAYALGDNPGMRATAIPTTAVTSLGGSPAVEAGDYVDVVAADKSGALTLTDIEVLGWVQSTSGGGIGGQSTSTSGIILDVPAQYEQQIATAAFTGKIQLFLRPYTGGNQGAQTSQDNGQSQQQSLFTQPPGATGQQSSIQPSTQQTPGTSGQGAASQSSGSGQLFSKPGTANGQGNQSAGRQPNGSASGQ